LVRASAGPAALHEQGGDDHDEQDGVDQQAPAGVPHHRLLDHADAERCHEDRG